MPLSRPIRSTSNTRRAAQLLAALGGVALITYFAYSVVPVNASTVGFAYLLFVLIIAATLGFAASLVCASAATLAFNFFFFPPVGTLRISDPHNWISLVSFMACALIASRLSDQARRRAIEAVEHRRDVERLYAFSRAILLIEEGELVAKQLAARLAEAFDLDASVLYDARAGEFYRAGPTDFEGLDDQLRECALGGAAFSDPERNRVITSVRLGAELIGSLAVQGERMPDGVLQGITNLIAIGMERARAHDLSHQVEAARRSEQLRTTLIDAMAHEFKTPLTSVKAATTSLLSTQELSPAARELIEIADEEAEHLRRLIDDAVEMARLDTAQIEIQPVLHDAVELAREVIAARCAEADGRSIELTGAASQPVAFDRRLVRLALRQLLDNALKYSAPGTPIIVYVEASGDGAAIEVVNSGPGIPPAEQRHIFDRFYRGPGVKKQVPGSGLGLSIAHRIAQAHHGRLTVSSVPGRTAFRLFLPFPDKERP
jgi:two-component system, OmpR family, sensor histidine kinase KdpD